MAVGDGLTDSRGQPVVLGKPIGSGGEGTVYKLGTDGHFVAKVYHRPIDNEKALKLQGMVRVANEELKKVAAWPVATLFRGREPAGLIMQQVLDCWEIFELYSPAQRKISFPKADWSFLIYAARNLAVAVSKVHDNGHVIGDINQKNVVTSRDATVKLIDCDSFQVRIDGRVYRCGVGVRDFTPPELQQMSFRDVIRTTNHDNFGLAVLIFHLLFVGRHPFTGRFLGNRDLTVDTAISEFRFAFGPAAKANQMAPPPSAPPLDIVSPAVAGMFQAAFSRDSARSGARPNSHQWISSLDALLREIRGCASNGAHKYYRVLEECPWCAIELRGGPDFFSALTASLGHTRFTAANFEMDRVWHSISSAAAPRRLDVTVNLPNLAASPFSPSERVTRYAIRSFEILGLASIGAYCLAGITPFIAVLFLLLWIVSANLTGYGRKRRRLAADANKSEGELRRNQSEGMAEHAQSLEDFERKRKSLGEAKLRYADLLKRAELEKKALKSDRRHSQLNSFLAGYMIERAQIAGIGPSLKSKLRSWNIETAADVTEPSVQAVPGFGPAKDQSAARLEKKPRTSLPIGPEQGRLRSGIGSD